MTFDPERLLRVLNRHGVVYVIIGGLAAIAHGSTLPTEDVDLAPARDRANLDRLGAALREMGARLRTGHAPAGVEFPCDGAFLAAQPTMLNLVSDLGDIDLTIAPTGFPRGYDDLIDHDSDRVARRRHLVETRGGTRQGPCRAALSRSAAAGS